MSWGVKSSSLLRSFGLTTAIPGKPYYISDEADVTTWKGTVRPDGSVSDLQLFANQGGEAVTTDAQGNVYLAAGQIYVYSPQGKLIDIIEVPERPLQILFGGKDGRTLFIAARTALYAVSR
jgi:sugar lactone lactonase YvrE